MNFDNQSSSEPRQVFTFPMRVLKTTEVGEANTFWCLFSRLVEDWAIKVNQAIRYAYNISTLGEGPLRRKINSLPALVVVALLQNCSVNVLSPFWMRHTMAGSKPGGYL